MAQSIRFYSGKLGFRLIESQLPYYARLRSPIGRQTMALHRASPEHPMDASKEGVRLYFEVRDLDAFCQRLRKRGVVFTQSPKLMEWGWRHAYLEDPDGHEISLYWAGSKRLKPTR